MLTVVNLRLGSDLPGSLNIGVRNIYSMDLRTGLEQSFHDLSYSASDIQDLSTGGGGEQRIGVFGIERRVPFGQKLCVIFVFPVVRFLVAHRAGTALRGSRLVLVFLTTVLRAAKV